METEQTEQQKQQQQEQQLKARRKEVDRRNIVILAVIGLFCVVGLGQNSDWGVVGIGVAVILLVIALDNGRALIPVMGSCVGEFRKAAELPATPQRQEQPSEPAARRSAWTWALPLALFGGGLSAAIMGEGGAAGVTVFVTGVVGWLVAIGLALVVWRALTR